MYKPSKECWAIILCFQFFFVNTTYASHVLLIREVKHDVSPPLTEMHPVHLIKPKHPIIVPLNHLPISRKPFTSQRDTVLQYFRGAPLNITQVNSFVGIGVGLGGYSPSSTPPDTTGAPGLTQYVQVVNTSYAIFNKSDGSLLFGPADTNTLWAGFGGVCETTNHGDGLVKYDQLANRWVISQFAFNTLGMQKLPPFLQCVAISTTSDARGPYTRYAFEFDNFNDYGKIGLGATAYYMSFFMFNNANAYLGPLACAISRDDLLAGKSTQMQCMAPSQGSQISLLPADLDGKTLPPPKTPGFFLSLNPTTREIAMWKLAVNFTNPARTSLSGPSRIIVAPYSIPCTDTGPRDSDEADGCIPQPNTDQTLDLLGDRLMYRLAYRQFANTGTLVVNHSVSGTTALSGVRWYQINILNDGLYTPHLIQEGTFSPDANSRWMGSAAIDKNKNIAIGYSVSSNSEFPSIAITGRMPRDLQGMLRNEVQVVAGGGSQLGSTRWGDYSTMAIDPVDDCTFWYTTEFLQTTGNAANWSTQIIAFKFPNCS